MAHSDRDPPHDAMPGPADRLTGAADAFAFNAAPVFPSLSPQSQQLQPLPPKPPTPGSTQSALTSFDPLEVIGSGSFGIIRKVRRKTDGKIMARKEIDYRKMSDREKRQLVAEVNILRELRHPHIVRYFERYVDRENCMIYIIMEYCEGGDLSTVIKRCRREGRAIPEPVVWGLFSQLLLALSECHHPRGVRSGSPRPVILHRDLKPDNVFLDAGQNVKLGDFGLSRVVDDAETQFARTYVGTPFYMSPELVNEASYNAKSDIWSLGCLIYELCALEPPFQAKSQVGLAAKIKLGKVPDLPKAYSAELGRVIKSMLQVNHQKRPSAADLLKLDRVQVYIAQRELTQAQAEVKRREEDLARREEELRSKERDLRDRERDLAVREREMAARERRVGVMEPPHFLAPSAEPPQPRPLATFSSDSSRIPVPISVTAAPGPPSSSTSLASLTGTAADTLLDESASSADSHSLVDAGTAVSDDADLPTQPDSGSGSGRAGRIGGMVGGLGLAADVAWWLKDTDRRTSGIGLGAGAGAGVGAGAGAKAGGAAAGRKSQERTGDARPTASSAPRRKIATITSTTISPRFPPPVPRKSPARASAAGGGAPGQASNPDSSGRRAAHPPARPNSNPPRPHPHYAQGQRRQSPVSSPPSPRPGQQAQGLAPGQLQTPATTPYRPGTALLEPMSITPVNRRATLDNAGLGLMGFGMGIRADGARDDITSDAGSAPSSFVARLQGQGYGGGGGGAGMAHRTFSGPTGMVGSGVAQTPVSAVTRDLGRLDFGSPMQVDATPSKG